MQIRECRLGDTIMGHTAIIILHPCFVCGKRQHLNLDIEKINCKNLNSLKVSKKEMNLRLENVYDNDEIEEFTYNSLNDCHKIFTAKMLLTERCRDEI